MQSIKYLKIEGFFTALIWKALMPCNLEVSSSNRKGYLNLIGGANNL